MRGFPALNALLLLAGLSLLWIPLARLTGAPDRIPEAPQSDAPHQESPVRLSLRFAHPPLSLRVSHLDTVVWETSDPEAMADGTVIQLAIPPEGIDLALSATWPDGTPESALQLELEPEGLDTQSAVVWGEGSVDEILAFVWTE